MFYIKIFRKDFKYLVYIKVLEEGCENVIKRLMYFTVSCFYDDVPSNILYAISSETLGQNFGLGLIKFKFFKVRNLNIQIFCWPIPLLL